jgi:SUKH-3 immunity protein
MIHNIDPLFKEYLFSCGWCMGRRVSPKIPTSSKFSIFPKALEILNEWDYILFRPNKTTESKYECFDVLVDATFGPGNHKKVKKFSDSLGMSLYPIAVAADNQVGLYISENGSIYGLYLDFFYVGHDFLSSVKSVTHGLIPPPNW